MFRKLIIPQNLTIHENLTIQQSHTTAQSHNTAICHNTIKSHHTLFSHVTMSRITLCVILASLMLQYADISAYASNTDTKTEESTDEYVLQKMAVAEAGNEGVWGACSGHADNSQSCGVGRIPRYCI